MIKAPREFRICPPPEWGRRARAARYPNGERPAVLTSRGCVSGVFLFGGGTPAGGRPKAGGICAVIFLFLEKERVHLVRYSGTLCRTLCHML